MGCGGSTEESEKAREDKQKSRKVDQDIAKSAAQDEKEIKLLLLGAGGSGKSTLFKQLQFIKNGGYDTKARMGIVTHIHGQMIEALQKLIEACEEKVDDEEEVENREQFVLFSEENKDDNEIKDKITFVKHLKVNTVLFDDKTVEVLNDVWNMKQIQAMFELRNEICVPDSTSYFFNDIKRVAKKDFVPNDKDLLLVRKRTIGMQEKFFKVDNHQFKLVDVGGQRNERKKWIHFFDNVTAVIFVVSLSCYDETIFEEDKNGMEESMEVFSKQVNSSTFRDTNFILFLNKSDLFEEKVVKTPITVCSLFTDYQGPKNDYGESLKHIKKKFEDANQHKGKDVFQHVTCATNKDNVQKVFNDVQTMIITQSLADTGLG